MIIIYLLPKFLTFILKQDIPTHAHACRSTEGLQGVTSALYIKETWCVRIIFFMDWMSYFVNYSYFLDG